MVEIQLSTTLEVCILHFSVIRILHLIARLRDIKANIYSYNATLYRACANANPHNMNEAMIGISKEVRTYISSSSLRESTYDVLVRADPTAAGTNGI